MTNLNKTLLLSALLVGFSATAAAECTNPSAPIVPDGNVASMDELVAAQKGLKAYQANLVDYRECLVAQKVDETNEDEAALQKNAALNAAYDSSVDAESAAAEEFNAAVRIFKSR
jgi:GTPase involved in cell partitioning and DNA repair